MYIETKPLWSDLFEASKYFNVTKQKFSTSETYHTNYVKKKQSASFKKY